MIILLAPSKTLDFETSAPLWVQDGAPLFQAEAKQIAGVLASMNMHELAKLMHVSEAIARTNHARFLDWGKVAKPALWAYRGDVYKGMYADQLTQADGEWANEHLVIMSGLYGIVRPYDTISPYRLEMKAKMTVAGKKNLYDFWGEKLVGYVDGKSEGYICNLSSDEYARPVTRFSKSKVITPIFFDHRPTGKVGAAPIYNKMMRGVMAHWMIKNQINDPARLREFTGHNYAYDAGRSTPNAPAFIRDKMEPLQF